MIDIEIKFWLMVLGHLFADYTLQGWLANGKQKSWWQKSVHDFEKSEYRFDYIAALACHALYWAIIVCIPFFGFRYMTMFILINAVIHAWIDNEKANEHTINLIQDQLLHVLQIVGTLFVYAMMRGGAS